MELTRAIKLLNLTRSENDNEALIAIRKLNSSIPCWDAYLKNVATREKLKETFGGVKKSRPASTMQKENFNFEIPLWEVLSDIDTYGTTEQSQFARDVLTTNKKKGSVSHAAALRAREIHAGLTYE